MVKARQAPSHSFVESRLASNVVASAADLALTVDGDGVILEVTVGEGIEPNPAWNRLVGQRWIDTLARDSQGKVEPLLAEVRSAGRTVRSRELNQKVEGLGEVPFRFSGVLLGAERCVLALGRDLRVVSHLQQRIISAQQAMEREHGRLRQADTRYRAFFQVSAEGVLVVDATNRRVLEANPAAASMLGEPVASLQGRALLELFETTSHETVHGLLAAVEAGARPSDVRVRLRGQTERDITLSAALFRQAGAALVTIRFWSGATSLSARASRMLAVLDVIPDGFVVVGEDRRVLGANPAFCELVHRTSEARVKGEPLDRWLGRPGVDINILIASLREHGSIRNFATILRSDYGTSQEALVTGVSALDGKVPCLGFTIRAVSSRLLSEPATSSVLPRSVEQLRELVGRVPLKELVRESTDLVERLCIEAALDVSRNNRASAAQLLGLSRQGLYSKLRRHGLSEFGPA